MKITILSLIFILLDNINGAFVTVEVDKRCREAFTKYAGASCIVYDDEDCDDKDAALGLVAGEEKSLVSSSDLYDNIESVSVAFGCYLQMWRDENFSDESGIIENITTNDKYQRLLRNGLGTGIHVTLDRNPTFEKFDDKVNSMKCVCL